MKLLKNLAIITIFFNVLCVNCQDWIEECLLFVPECTDSINFDYFPGNQADCDPKCPLFVSYCGTTELEQISQCIDLDSTCAQKLQECAEFIGITIGTTTTSTTTETETTTITEDSTTTETAETTSRPNPTHPTTENPKNKMADFHYMCCVWAAEGHCDKNWKFMRPLCQTSCGTPGCRVENAYNCVVNVNLDHCEHGPTNTFSKPKPPDIQMRGSSKPYLPQNVDPLVLTVPSCTDNHRKCQKWASNNFCQTNPYWMQINCQRSCNCCGCTYASIAGLTYNFGCHDYQQLCPFWASVHGCQTNRRYMKSMCRAACGLC